MEHSLENSSHFRIEFDARMVVVVEVVIEPFHSFDLFCDDLREETPFHSEQTTAEGFTIFNSGLYAHPKRHAGDNFEEDASHRPDVDDPRVVVLLDLAQQLGVVLKLILEKDVVEDLWRHVFRRRHRKLLEIGKEKAASEVDDFDAFDVAWLQSSAFLLPSEVEQNILGL